MEARFNLFGALGVAVLALAPACKKKPKDDAAESDCPGSVAVTIDWPGASPYEVERGLVIAAEEALVGLEPVTAIHAAAREGQAAIEVEVTGDPQRVQRQIYAALERLSSLPEGAEPPRVWSPPRFESLILAGVAGRTKPARLEAIERSLRAVDGVVSVAVLGAPRSEVRVIARPERLVAYGLSVDDLARGIRRHPGALAERPIGSTPGGTPIKLGDVARIERGRADGSRAWSGGASVVVFAVAAGDEAPDPDALRAAGVDQVSAPMAAAICPRGYGLGLDAIVATGLPSIDPERLADRVADQPVIALAGADLLDRGASGVEIVALKGGDDVLAALRSLPGFAIEAPGKQVAFVELTGEDPDALARAATQIASAAAKLAGVAGISELPGVGAPELRVKSDREKLAAFGLTVFDVTLALRRATDGEVAAIDRRGAQAVAIRVFAGEPGDSLHGLEDLRLIGRDGSLIPLSAVARLDRARTRWIYRRDRRRRYHLRIALDDAEAASRVEAASNKIAAGIDGVRVAVSVRGL